MHILLHRLEKVVDLLIGPMLIILLLVVIAELFFEEQFHELLVYTDYFDSFIISLFVVDLGFKFSRVRKIPKFVRKYWMEILAAVPFFLIFRFTEFFGIQEFIERGQTVVHEAPELQKLERETSAIVKEAGKSARTARIIRSFRVISRLPRFLKVIPFFEKPSGDHHWHEKEKKVI